VLGLEVLVEEGNQLILKDPTSDEPSVEPSLASGIRTI
jgi:hypothetical protein